MAVFRQFSSDRKTVVLTYAGNPITPEMRTDDPAEILDVLSAVIEKAYQKLRDSNLV